MQKRKKWLFLALAALLIPGCKGEISNFAKAGLPEVKKDAEPFAGIKFSPLSALNAKYLEGQTDSSTKLGSSSPAASLTVPNMPSGISGNAYGSYMYGYYGLDREMSLVSASQAETSGYNGSSFQELLQTIVTPVVKNWATDARMVRSEGDLAEDGTLGEGGFNPSWRLSYISAERQEEIDFVVGASKTLVIRLHWAPLNLSPETVAVDSATALKTLKAAIVDQEAKSEEEKSGIDYFLGTAFVKPGYSTGYKSEVLYQLPAAARWGVGLRYTLGHLFWVVNANPTSPMEQSGPGYWLNSSVTGMIDAQSGALIRFSRPSKVFYVMPSPMLSPVPGVNLPFPSITPTPCPTATPAPSDNIRISL
ncbi:MAG TPA: hypothetical protein DD435_10555 [Cyanobacteria bacterium UBA8530]|nr:hypothetical protein [Cyanobacteria bacterium UBA8530]